jgi:TubC N-terminal docking domain
MSAAQVLSELRQQGIEVTLAGSGLHLRGQGAGLTEEQRHALQEHKPELLALLEAEQQPPTPAAQPEPAPCPRARRQRPVLPPRRTTVQIATAKDGEHTVFEIQAGGKRISDAGWFVGPQWAKQYARERGWKVIESQNARGGSR